MFKVSLLSLVSSSSRVLCTKIVAQWHLLVVLVFSKEEKEENSLSI